MSATTGSGGAQSRALWMLWGGAALVVALLPLVFSSGASLTMMSLMGFAIIFALSYNMLLGQTGMLSFGHAVYYGLGGFITAHALNVVGAGKLPIPLPVMPLVGGLAGLTFAVIFGWVSTKRAGTAFAMISLGIGELVAACSLILRGFFGGEGGISTSRTATLKFFGLNFGPQLQVYYLIAAWTLLCIGAMYAITRTPLGRMCNAVRDNPERAEFVGYDPRWVRCMMVVLSGFFAGVAGGLTALNYEIVTAETLAASTSGIVIMMAFVGGVGYFHGPILGAALITVLQIVVAGVTEAWPFYFGLLFTGLVLYAPGGIAGILAAQKRLFDAGQLGRAFQGYALLALPFALCIAGLIALVEMAYAVANTTEPGSAPAHVFGLTLNAGQPAAWAIPVIALVLGGVLLRAISRRLASRDDTQYAALRQRQA